MSKKLDKWALPGWKNEPKYGYEVLVGNWFEERRQFPNGNPLGNSTNRVDYCIPTSHVTDVVTRRKLAQRNWVGVGEHMLLTHHGKAYMSGEISNYVLDYNHPSFIPPYRRWDRHSSTWVPERLDAPLQEEHLQKHSKKKDLHSESTMANGLPENDNKKQDKLPHIYFPKTADRQVVMKYRHRKTDVSPVFPVILRSKFVVKID